MGFRMDVVSFQWKVTESQESHPVRARLVLSRRPDLEEPVYDSGETTLDSTGSAVPVALEASVRYYWAVSVTDDAGDTTKSDVAWFETPKPEKDWSA